jgi:hypothetical protein
VLLGSVYRLWEQVVSNPKNMSENILQRTGGPGIPPAGCLAFILLLPSRCCSAVHPSSRVICCHHLVGLGGAALCPPWREASGRLRRRIDSYAAVAVPAAPLWSRCSAGQGREVTMSILWRTPGRPWLLGESRIIGLQTAISSPCPDYFSFHCHFFFASMKSPFIFTA